MKWRKNVGQKKNANHAVLMEIVQFLEGVSRDRSELSELIEDNNDVYEVDNVKIPSQLQLHDYIATLNEMMED